MGLRCMGFLRHQAKPTVPTAACCLLFAIGALALGMSYGTVQLVPAW